jgi:hypothetical protein
MRHLIVPAVLGLLSAGCGGDAASVSGLVSYEDQPVANGYVTFAPADGKGPVVGGAVTNGRYAVANVPPGPKVVKVEASSGAGPSVQTSEDAARVSKELKGKYGADGIIRTETVPPDAAGNNQAVEVRAGSQTLDLALKKPAGKK